MTNQALSTFQLFEKYLKLVDPLDSFKFARLEQIETSVNEYGAEIVEGLIFGWFKILVYKTIVQTLNGKKEKLEYQMYEEVITHGSYEEPPDYDENLVETFDSPVEAFTSVFKHLMTEHLDNALMAEYYEAMKPYIVNCINADLEDGTIEQIFYEADNAQHAVEQCRNAYPNCTIIKVMEQGEE